MPTIDWNAAKGILDLGDQQLEWQCWGTRSEGQPVLVMLHEGLGCTALWRSFPSDLCAATGLPVFAYSRAGYGQSSATALPRPLDYMQREAAQTLPKIIDALDDPDIILLGHSDGASIAACYSGWHASKRMLGSILIAPHFFTEPHGLKAIAEAKQAFESTDLPRKMAKYHRDANATFYGWNDAWLHPDFAKWNIEDALDGIQCPTLVIQGLDDQYGTPAQCHCVAARSPSAVEIHLLDNCQHAPHLEQPDQTLGLIAQFVEPLKAHIPS